MPTDPGGYQQSDFTHPTRICDLVMKGGVSSGVVYPLAAAELAKDFRFNSIGGTSAGAIAAAVTAAAEYGRASGGFVRLSEVPKQIGGHLMRLFQPSPRLAAVLDIFLALQAPGSWIVRVGRVLGIAVRRFVGRWLLGLLAGIVFGVVAVLSGAPMGYAVAWGTGLFVLIGLVTVASTLYRRITRDVPANGYGLCPGGTQRGFDTPGLTDWLTDLIDHVAGRGTGPGDPPLTFDDLSTPPGNAPPIALRMMTTNLMMRRPFTVPLRDHSFLFRKQEFENLFPPRVMNYLMANSERFDTGNPADDFFHLPSDGKLPVAIGARMSLSFPLLISAIPLYARDFTLNEAAGRSVPRLCLFSDGGLASNFPIHFFDKLWPNHPTFGISLDDFNPARNIGPGRAWLPETANSGVLIPILPIEGGLLAFLQRLIDAAKDWQDNLQSTLPGYRERIVHVALKPDEGGLNLTMDATMVGKLAHYGADAGELARDVFNFDEHRWRRFLVAMARMEQTLDEFTTAWDGDTVEKESFQSYLMRYPAHAQTYQQDSARLAEMLRRAAALVEMGRAWRNPPDIRDGQIPKPDTNLSITPKP
jgi:predicted acylesterase/phospholipase RssA